MGAPAILSIGSEAPDQAAETRIVVVDTHHDRRQLMRYVLELGSRGRASVAFAEGPDSAVGAVERLDADAVLVEVQIPVAHGLETVRRLREAAPELRIVVCSFHTDAPTMATALSLGADAYLKKPLRPTELYHALRKPTAATTTKERS